MSRFEGNIAGKNIITYSPKGNRRYSAGDIAQYLRQFKLCDALRLIGEISKNIHKSNQGVCYESGVPVFNGVLAYLSMLLIENSNDYRSKDMTIKELLKAIDMFFGLPDPFEEDESNPQGCFVRFGASQFDYDREARHLLPRTLIIYRDLWNTVADKSKVDVDAAIQDISGLTLQEILILALAFTGKAEKGFFSLYDELEKYPDSTKKYFKLEKQQAFVDFVSCSYQDFRTQSRDDIPPDVSYNKFRFNPLYLKPAIIPDRNVNPGFSQVYITPIPSLIYEKVTRGLYFLLADYFRTDKGNPFRRYFGYVFQQYVGLLLKEVFGENNVKQEWRYGTNKEPKDTPDWFVIQNGLTVLIEVKQAGLYLNAKKWGELQEIQDNLTKSIGSGVHQMYEFEHDLENGLCTYPNESDNIQITERLVVTYDRSYFLNSILRDEIRQLYPSIPKDYHWHTIAVEELEYFLGIVGTEFISALTEKKLDVEGDSMDFRDYYSRKYSKDDCMNPYLDTVYNGFFSDLDISG
ncbi:MAG: hypothetical protein AB4040_14625 [Synechococcus sp.]